MENNRYAKACTEVLELLSYLPEEEYSKIPSDRIDMLNQYKDTGYEYSINPEIELSEQHISKEAKAMIVEIYLEYFANEHQKNVIDDILNQNQMLAEKQKEIDYYKTYGKNDTLINGNIKLQNDDVKEQDDSSIKNETASTEMVKYKETFFTKLKRFIFKIFHIEEK